LFLCIPDPQPPFPLTCTILVRTHGVDKAVFFPYPSCPVPSVAPKPSPFFLSLFFVLRLRFSIWPFTKPTFSASTHMDTPFFDHRCVCCPLHFFNFRVFCGFSPLLVHSLRDSAHCFTFCLIIIGSRLINVNFSISCPLAPLIHFGIFSFPRVTQVFYAYPYQGLLLARELYSGNSFFVVSCVLSPFFLTLSFPLSGLSRFLFLLF